MATRLSVLGIALFAVACATSVPIDAANLGGPRTVDAASDPSSYGSDDASSSEDAAGQAMDASVSSDAPFDVSTAPPAIDSGIPATGGNGDCPFTFAYEVKLFAAPSSATVCDVSGPGGTECASTECCFAGTCVPF